MKLKIFTIPLNHELGAFDDRAMQAFLDDKEVLSLFEHFFVIEGTPTWTILVTYRDLDQRARQVTNKENSRDLRAQLPAESRLLFDTLCRWRRDRAINDGVASYVLLTNKQVAALAIARPSTLADLTKIKGIGESKAKKYGEDLLALIASVPLQVEEKTPVADEVSDG
jgi:superfamily II DNA helicase RecQ